jgi:hypothetical protein
MAKWFFRKKSKARLNAILLGSVVLLVDLFCLKSILSFVV